MDETEYAATMFLVGLLFPELFGRARRIERLHWPADLEAVFGAAGILIAHVSNASFRVANVCAGRTPSPRRLTSSSCGGRRTPLRPPARESPGVVDLTPLCCTSYDRGGNYFHLLFSRIAKTSSIKARRLSGGRSLGWMVCF